jgi:hypothetical protein
MGEELMKGGVRDPAKYFIKSEALQNKVKGDQLSPENNGTRSRAASRSNKSRNGEEQIQEVLETEEHGATRKVSRTKSGVDEAN